MVNPGYMKALVIEDDPIAQQLIARYLKTSGLVALFADTLSDAIALAARVEPQLVFIDLNLPDGRGEVLIQRVRLEPSMADAVLVVVTAESDLAIRESVLEAGVDKFIEKPIQPGQVKDAVTLAIRRYQK